MLDQDSVVPELVPRTIPVSLTNILLSFGNTLVLWLVLFVLAVILLIIHRPWRFEPFAMLLALPLAAAFAYWVMALDNVRYFWWAIAGYTLIMGLGLAYLLPSIRPLLLIVLVIV